MNDEDQCKYIKKFELCVLTCIDEVFKDLQVFVSLLSSEENLIFQETLARVLVAFDFSTYYELDDDFKDDIDDFEGEILDTINFMRLNVCRCTKIFISERIIFTLELINQVLKNQSDNIVITSVGAGDLLQEYVLARELSYYNCGAKLNFIDDSRSTGYAFEFFKQGSFVLNNSIKIEKFYSMKDDLKNCQEDVTNKPTIMLAVDLELRPLRSGANETDNFKTDLRLVDEKSGDSFFSFVISPSGWVSINIDEELLVMDKDRQDKLDKLCQEINTCLDDPKTMRSNLFLVAENMIKGISNNSLEITSVIDPFFQVVKLFEVVAADKNAQLFTLQCHLSKSLQNNYFDIEIFSPLEGQIKTIKTIYKRYAPALKILNNFF